MKKQTDLLIGSPWKQVLIFSIPLMLGNLFQQFYSMADAFIISRTLGVEAFAGVSCTHSFSFLIIGFGTGMTSGITIPMAQRFGAGDAEAVRDHYYQNILICVLIAVALTVLSMALIGPGLKALGTPDEIFGYASNYLQTLFAGILFMTLYNYFANVLRALGDSRSPFIYLLIASVINIVLDYVLIRYTHMGVRGAAVATVFSQTISAVLCFLKIRRSIPMLSPKGYHLHLDGRLIAGNLRLGLPMGLQSSLIAVGVVFVQGAINRMGTSSIAAYAAGGQIDGVGVEPLRSVGIALSTFTAQNYGAGKNDRIIKGVRQIVWITLGMSVILGLILCLFGRVIAACFVGWEQTEVLDQAQRFLTIHGILYPFLALLFDWRFALQGLGNARIVVIGSVMELIARFSSAMLLIPIFDFFGACIETPVSWIAALIPVAIVYARTVKQLK